MCFFSFVHVYISAKQLTLPSIQTQSRRNKKANCYIEDANGIACIAMLETMIEENSGLCGSNSVTITVTACSEGRLYYQWDDASYSHLWPVGTQNPANPDLLECQHFESNPHRTRCQQQCYTCGNGYRKPCDDNLFFCECGCVSDEFTFEECVAVCPPFPVDWNEECVSTCAAECPPDTALGLQELPVQRSITL